MNYTFRLSGMVGLGDWQLDDRNFATDANAIEYAQQQLSVIDNVDFSIIIWRNGDYVTEVIMKHSFTWRKP